MCWLTIFYKLSKQNVQNTAKISIFMSIQCTWRRIIPTNIQKNTHWANNLKRFSISRNRRERKICKKCSDRHHITLKEVEMKRKKTLYPNYKEYCQHFFFHLLSLCASVDKCIVGLFQSILCVRYLASSTITVFSSRSYFCFVYPFFGIWVPIAPYCAPAHYWLVSSLHRSRVFGCSILTVGNFGIIHPDNACHLICWTFNAEKTKHTPVSRSFEWKKCGWAM